MKIQITGVREIQDALIKLNTAINIGAEKAAKRMADILKEEAKNSAPIGTPQSTGIPDYIISEASKKSIRRTQFRKQRNRYISGVRYGGLIVNPNTGRKVDYAKALEFGHSRKQAPRGILRPAVGKTSNKMLRAALLKIRLEMRRIK